MSFFVSRFCNSKVMETQSANCRSLSEWGSCFFPLKNLMLSTFSSFIFLYPDTLTYSQERIAKKNAPMNSSQSALFDEDEVDSL